MIFQVGNNFSQKFSGITHVVKGLNYKSCDKIFDSKKIISFLIESKKADLIIVHGIFNIYSILCPLVFQKKKLHLILHGQTQKIKNLKFKKYFWIKVLKLLVKNYNTIQYLSEGELSNCQLNIDHNKIIIPNGVNLKKIKKVRQFNKPLKLLYIGRIDESQKGLLSFFKFNFSENIIFNVYGPTSKTKNLIKKLGKKNVFIHEAVYDSSKKTKLFIEHDFAFLPSYFEGVPIFALESLSHGLPLICTEACNLNFLKKTDSVLQFSSQLKMKKFINNINYQEYNREYLFNQAKKSISKISWGNIRQSILSIYFLNDTMKP